MGVLWGRAGGSIANLLLDQDQPARPTKSSSKASSPGCGDASGRTCCHCHAPPRGWVGSPSRWVHMCVVQFLHGGAACGACLGVIGVTHSRRVGIRLALDLAGLCAITWSMRRPVQPLRASRMVVHLWKPTRGPLWPSLGPLRGLVAAARGPPAAPHPSPPAAPRPGPPAAAPSRGPNANY